MAFSEAFDPNTVATLEEGVAFGDGFGDSFNTDPVTLEEGVAFSEGFDSSFEGGAETPVTVDDGCITFNGLTKRIHITCAGTYSVRAIYSAWKTWVFSGNVQWLPAFRTVGGDPTVQVDGTQQYAPSYYFLTHGWRVVVDGIDTVFTTNLYTDEGELAVLTYNNGTARILNSDVGQIGASDIQIDASQLNIDYSAIAAAVWAATPRTLTSSEQVGQVTNNGMTVTI